MATHSWPLFDLEVRTDEVTLRYPTDDDLAEAVNIAAEHGVHAPELMPFMVPWTRHDSPQLQQEALRFHWQCRADTRPGRFRIPLTVLADDTIVGMSEAGATDFPVLRQVTTGSWLGLPWHGRGIGTAMRRATLALAFDGLDAARAVTEAWSDNGPSLGVTRKLGYSDQGRRWDNREGTPAELFGFEMDRQQYERIRPNSVEFVGLDGVRDFLEIA